MKRLVRKADDENYLTPSDYVFSAPCSFNRNYDTIENDNITKTKYNTGLNIPFSFEKDLDYPENTLLNDM